MPWTQIAFSVDGTAYAYVIGGGHPEGSGRDIGYLPRGPLVTIPVLAKRDGDSALLNDAVLIGSLNGKEFARLELGTPRSSFYGYKGRLDGELPEVGGERTKIDLKIVSEGFGVEETGSLVIPTPPATDPKVRDVTVSCETPDTTVGVGESVEVSGVLQNTLRTPLTATAKIEAGGASETVTTQIPAEGTSQVSSSFVFETPGDNQPSISVESVEQA